jgi:3-deoxy-D-manno-octulosonic-acid transferase
MWTLYNILFPFVYLLMTPYYVVRMWRRGGYGKGFMQRFGLLDRETRAELSALHAAGADDDRCRPVWIHAVSVGEIQIALRFIEAWIADEPDTVFVVTTTTSTGHRVMETQKPAGVILLYFPVDTPLIMARSLTRLMPRLVVLVECEIWPNLIRECSRRSIAIGILNGRLSDNSYRGYCRFRRFAANVMGRIDMVCTQDEEDARRYRDLGAGHVRVVGSAKYDVAQVGADDAAIAREILQKLGVEQDRPLVVGGSTWAGEEDALLSAFDQLLRIDERALLVLVPRHFERSGAIEEAIRKKSLRYFRRSQLETDVQEQPGGDELQVLLVDTVGELRSFYAAATVIFVGKSLTQHGGQNLVEPAAYGKPVVVGPNMENFRTVTRDLLNADAILQVADEAGLVQRLSELLVSGVARTSYGDRAARLVEGKRGSLQRSAEILRSVLTSQGES